MNDYDPTVFASTRLLKGFIHAFMFCEKQHTGTSSLGMKKVRSIKEVNWRERMILEEASTPARLCVPESPGDEAIPLPFFSAQAWQQADRDCAFQS